MYALKLLHLASHLDYTIINAKIYKYISPMKYGVWYL